MRMRKMYPQVFRNIRTSLENEFRDAYIPRSALPTYMNEELKEWYNNYKQKSKVIQGFRDFFYCLQDILREDCKIGRESSQDIFRAAVANRERMNRAAN